MGTTLPNVEDLVAATMKNVYFRVSHRAIVHLNDQTFVLNCYTKKRTDIDGKETSVTSMMGHNERK